MIATALNENNPKATKLFNIVGIRFQIIAHVAAVSTAHINMSSISNPRFMLCLLCSFMFYYDLVIVNVVNSVPAVLLLVG